MNRTTSTLSIMPWRIALYVRTPGLMPCSSIIRCKKSKAYWVLATVNKPHISANTHTHTHIYRSGKKNGATGWFGQIQNKRLRNTSLLYLDSRGCEALEWRSLSGDLGSLWQKTGHGWRRLMGAASGLRRGMGEMGQYKFRDLLL